MASIRQQKISSIIKRELALIFQQESRNLFEGRFITVTIVRVSSDLGLAKTYISFLAVKDPKAELKKVNAVSNQIKHLLAQKVGKQLRRVPDLNFYLDDSLDYYEEIDRLLKE